VIHYIILTLKRLFLPSETGTNMNNSAMVLDVPSFAAGCDAAPVTRRPSALSWKTILLSAIVTVIAMAAGSAGAVAAPSVINAVGVENEYADVISQIGRQYVEVTAIETDPNTDPHTFEVSPNVARQIAAADLIVVNGIGYDDWAGKIIAATPNAGRRIINVQHLLGLPDSTPNPHLWYDPQTMPAVADALAKELSALMPAKASVFEANAKTFKASLKPWYDAIDSFKKDYPDTPVAATEPVANYMLEAAGDHLTMTGPVPPAVLRRVGRGPGSPSGDATRRAFRRGKRPACAARRR